MDAASNNSVDDIRDLRERVAYAPVSGRHKVYILDEAHMLSPQAWNAFLKTLEEPPPNTIFVLATTEAQKVLPTVVDRCHRFDFERPSVQEIATRARARRRPGGDRGRRPRRCALIARHATGCFRDALGTLEQLVTYGGERVDARRRAGGARRRRRRAALRTIDAVAARDAARRRCSPSRGSVDSGRDPALFFAQLEAHAARAAARPDARRAAGRAAA